MVDYFILVEVKINNTTFVMGNVYAPVNDEPKFFDFLFSAITKFPNNDLILAGDWNLVLNNQLDKDGKHPHANKNSKERLKSYMKFFNLNDVFRNFFPSKKVFTRIQLQPYTATRLDFFFSVKSVAVSQSVMSDHKIVSLSLFSVPNKRGNGYWKINNSILLDVNYITQIKQVISDFIVTNAQEDTSPHTLWETLKCIIRGETIKFCALRKKN